eukprot:10247001-Alexandrium_andersonii.AAC.1
MCIRDRVCPLSTSPSRRGARAMPDEASLEVTLGGRGWRSSRASRSASLSMRARSTDSAYP